jgi:nucleoside-diphosphate-sugar epimerase
VKAVLTGATGFVGSHLVDALLERGDRVRAVVRASSHTGRLEEQGVELAAANLDDVAGLAEAFAGWDVVFHVAGLIKAVEPREYFRVNAEGTRRVVEACRRASPRPRRLVLVSSQAAGGPGWSDRPRREEDQPRPVSPYGQSKLEAEQIAFAAGPNLQVTAIRPCVVYGPRDQAVQPLFRAVRWGVAPRLPTNPRISLIHAGDLAGCLVRAAEHPAAAGRVYFACGPAAGLTELTRLMGDGFGRRPFEIPIPAVALVAAGIAADLLSSLTRIPRPFGRQKAMEMLHTSWWCSGERAERELGFRPRIEHADGLAATAQWYREHGWT